MPDCEKLPLKQGLSAQWESFHSIPSAEVGRLGQTHVKYSQYHPQWIVAPTEVIEVTKKLPRISGTVTGQRACDFIRISHVCTYRYICMYEKYVCVCLCLYSYSYSPVTLYT